MAELFWAGLMGFAAGNVVQGLLSRHAPITNGMLLVHGATVVLLGVAFLII